MKIKMYEFDLMPWDEKESYIWENGTLLIQMSRRSGRNYTLFALDDFFVEMVVNDHSGEVESMEPFNEISNLYFYLDSIRLPKWIKVK